MKRVVALVTTAAFLAVGCARARMSLVARETHVPVSLSEGFFDADTLVLRERYEVVHHFRVEHDHVSLSGLAPVHVVDLTSELDGIAAQAGGDAVVNLRVVAHDKGGWWFLTFLLTMCTVGLIAPSYVGATVEGDVVRMLPPTPPAGAAADAPPRDAMPRTTGS
jgi:hypothetical protein